MKYKNWSVERWQKTLFTDESMFRVDGSSTSDIQFVRRKPGSDRYDDKFTRRKQRQREGVMIWGPRPSFTS